MYSGAEDLRNLEFETNEKLLRREETALAVTSEQPCSPGRDLWPDTAVGQGRRRDNGNRPVVCPDLMQVNPEPGTRTPISISTVGAPTLKDENAIC